MQNSNLNIAHLNSQAFHCFAHDLVLVEEHVLLELHEGAAVRPHVELEPGLGLHHLQALHLRERERDKELVLLDSPMITL